MLGFVLSKLNLLILVTAVFAIVAFFLLSITGIMAGLQAQDLVNRYTDSIEGILSGGADRRSTVTVRESIEYFGGLSPTKRLYYVMHIKRFPEEFQEGQQSSLILQIADRTDPDVMIAAANFNHDARVFLYEWDPETDILKEQSHITIDPESAGEATKNSFALVKEVVNGKKYLHIVACSSSAALCERNLGRASCWLLNCSEEKRKIGFTNPENCSTSC